MAARKNGVEEPARPEGPQTRLLDLDAERDAARLARQQVRLGGVVYTLRSPDEMAMAPKELLRVLLLRQETVASTPVAWVEGDDGLTLGQREALMDQIETEIVALALDPTPPDEVMADRAFRGRIVELFLDGLGELVLLPIVTKINAELLARQRQQLREIQMTTASPDAGAPRPASSAGTGNGPSTSSSATAVG